MHRHPNDIVKDFHKAFNHPINTKPTIPDKDQIYLRLRLIAEEFLELCDAMGVHVKIENTSDQHIMTIDTNTENDSVDIVEAADALGDLSYVIEGMNLVMGLPSKEVFDEIHKSNMSKLDSNGKPIYNDFGKVVKGPNYRPPQLKEIINHV